MIDFKRYKFNLFIFYAFGLFFLQACLEKDVNSENGESIRSFHEYYRSDFFKRVQLLPVFKDSKTFVDAVPKIPIQSIIEKYDQLKPMDSSQLKEFVLDHYDLPISPETAFQSKKGNSIEKHIFNLWPVLTRQSPDSIKTGSSLIPLPASYVVPGGRFREVYYWDSYFTMEGLMIDGGDSLVRNMLDNFSFLIEKYGFIPNGNRKYYLGRSQPPFFTLMVDLYAENRPKVWERYVEKIEAEYEFWMSGKEKLSVGEAHKRVVRLEDSVYLNRYFDDLDGPRPESYREDFELASSLSLANDTLFLDLRAGAESGWDYSSRWFADGKNLSTIQTTSLLPVDLNCLLFFMEKKLSNIYATLGNNEKEKRYFSLAENRKEAIKKYFWEKEKGFFFDFNWKTGKTSDHLTLAAVFPLYFEIAEEGQAKKVAENLNDKFLFSGGLVTTLEQTGEQWDYPNGWAPLQWMSVNGLFNYHYYELGNTVKTRWLTLNEKVFAKTGKMMEKYNVIDTTLSAGGGEYPLQDGFGWSNGVAKAFIHLNTQNQQ